MSELVSEGHHEAPDYPVAFVWEEVALVAERKNREMASQGTILQSAITTGVSAFGKDGGRKAHSAFQKLIKTLLGDDNHPDDPLRHPSEEEAPRRRKRG